MSRANKVRQPSLARRVSGWTSNFLATGIVLVAAVGVGRQLVMWWGVEPADAVAPEPAAMSNPGVLSEAGEQPFQLTFGAGYSLRRIELAGDLAAATRRLQAECRTILENAGAPLSPPRLRSSDFSSAPRIVRPLRKRSASGRFINSTASCRSSSP